MHPQTKERRFRRSALTEEGRFLTTAEALSWLRSTAAAARFAVEQIPFADLGEWAFDKDSGDLTHRSRKFFRVQGLHVSTDLALPGEWHQPIIDQPEIGILGIIVKEFDGQLHLLMQAKMEPGNPLGVQLVPTVQATRSNYTQVHQGARPQYVDYIIDRNLSRVLVDQLQFEQGSAFLRKRNRNIVVEVTGDVPVPEGYNWLTLGQVKALLREPNLVSMDTRTVISCMQLVERGHATPKGGSTLPTTGVFPRMLLASMTEEAAALHDRDEVLQWLTDLKCRHRLDVHRVELRSLPSWTATDREIAHEEGRFFRVLGVRVESDSREVARWSQPLVAAVQKGLIAFIVKQFRGTTHFLIQARVEPGNSDTVTVGPTVQLGLGYEQLSDPRTWPPFVDLVRDDPSQSLRYSCTQSEEGGRFFHLQSEYRVVELPSEANPRLPDNYLWVTLGQLQEMLRYGLVNVEARSLLACLSLIDEASA